MNVEKVFLDKSEEEEKKVHEFIYVHTAADFYNEPVAVCRKKINKINQIKTIYDVIFVFVMRHPSIDG